MSALEIVELGWSTTIQDHGRPGHAAIGVPTSGALDHRLHALVNRLVGNPDTVPVLETAGGLRLRAIRPCVVATSAEAAPRAVEGGALIEVDPAPGQLWAYLAVRGGIAVELVLGSASHDTLSGLGPPPLAHGHRLDIGPDPGTPLVVDQAPIADGGPGPVRIWPGPRLDWFVDGAWEQLLATTWTVSSDVSRVGARLDGPALERSVTDELPSEGMVLGALQVPPDGRPVVMLADHPTTGGYPVIAVVDPSSLTAVAQRRPGSELRFGVVR